MTSANDNRKTELLPCPFCGGEVEMLTAESMNGGYLFGIMCNDCRSRGDVYDTEAEAIAAWNSRADYHGYEQAAIEAWESIKAWNTRVAHGTLTAEQVEDIVYRNTKFYEGGDVDVQAITDELNAELGSGTCEIECFDDGVDEGMDGEWFRYAPPTWYLSCGHTAQGEKPNFCHVCGKAVE